jgi:Cysteine-rich CPCC
MDADEHKRRAQHFFEYCDRLENGSVRTDGTPGNRYACPCCGYLTLTQRGWFEVCEVCFWDDDGQDDHDADVVRGGANARLSLTRARRNFKAFRACEERFLEFVRDPMPHELPQAAPREC